ncbi:MULTISPECIES: relaxase/mobilization nuclease domain-containing protein [Psychrobacter]|uniref:relaxase/mobilization nuclease domain-containing protein n=1 Tax=Psychrobacter TaxID=497 RepID=UPI001868814F|nr:MULTISPECIES: relaxase/mobilization nuclease domain-containing protein [Psychrobacter]MBE8610708.1 relaxase/mobilization nuclease domain-containing protein [Pseudomonas lundensis]
MIVKFFRRGQGSGAGPLNYLLGAKDTPREGAKVLYGDPRLTEQLINTTPFKQKYKAGVLSFTEDAEGFTDKQKRDIMQRFEETLFVGLEPDQYDILWVEHTDKGGRLELNFVIPCQELRSGKRLQPFYAGADLVRVNAFKNIINQEYGLTDPNDPERKRLINPYVNNAPRPTPYDRPPKSKEKEQEKEDNEIIANPESTFALKEAIDRRMRHSLAEGSLNNRSSVRYALEGMGLTIKRATKSSISVAHPKMKRNVRLKGTVYEEGFQALAEERQQDYERVSESRGNRDLRTWTKGMEIKKAYHQELYGDIKAPEPLDLEIKDVVSMEQSQDATPRVDTPAPQRSYNGPRP